MKEAIAACRSLSFAKGHTAMIAESLKNTPKSMRLEALAALPGSGHQISAESFELITENFGSTAANSLAKSKLSNEQLQTLAPLVKIAGALDLPKVVAPLENL